MPRAFVARTGLQNLPVELICLILENLEMYDLLSCNVVSKHLRKVVKESSRLQYAIELAKHRMVSLLSPSATPSFSTRLKLLRDRESAWKYLDFKERHTLKLPPTGSVYEFVGGLYGNGREDDSRATASISFLELPSADAIDVHRDLQLWTHTMGDVTIIDFTMDPSQDLLVLVALAAPDSNCVYELHLRSIKTNRPHPNAPVSVLPCLTQPAVQPQPSEIVAAVRVQVSGNLVALLIKEVFESTGAHLEIWNWENGSQHSSAMSRVSGIDDFTFLTYDSFLLVRPNGRFEVYTFLDPINRSTVPVLRAIYPFPPLSEGYMYWYISMSSNPAPGYVPHAQEGPPSSGRQIYYPRPDERIHACCLYIFNPSNEENPVVHSFVFFLNLKTLLNPPADWIARSQQTRNGMSRRVAEPLIEVEISEDVVQQETPTPSSLTSVDIPIHGSNSLLAPVSGSSQNQPQPSSGIYIHHAPTYPPFPTFDSHTSNGTHPPPQSQIQSSSVNDRTPTYTSPTPRPNATSCHVSTLSAVTIPWEVWGPQSTRWFEECLSTDWQHAIYGLRTVESVRTHRHLDGLAFAPTPSVQPLGATNVNGAHPTGPPNNIPHGANPIFIANNGSTQASASNVNLSSNPNPLAQQPQPVQGESPGDNDEDDIGGRSSSPRRYLRVRDFNPYSFKDMDVVEASTGTSSDELEGDLARDGKKQSDGQSRGRVSEVDALRDMEKGKGRAANSRAGWRTPRLVTKPSTTPVKGVFTQDIVSSLPYTEVISDCTFEVTDVMMDDCRLLLLKRGKAGKLKRVEVLMM